MFTAILFANKSNNQEMFLVVIETGQSSAGFNLLTLVPGESLEQAMDCDKNYSQETYGSSIERVLERLA